MNPSTDTFTSAIPAAREEKGGGFYRRIVMHSLQQMTLGCLRLELPDGTQSVIGRPGEKISANVRVTRWSFFKRCVLFGDIGFGEAYMDGDWETDDITMVISWFILNIENSPAMSGSRAKKFLINLLGWQNRLGHLFNRNSPDTSRSNISFHYDLGNDFYKLFLDPTMTYSSALFTDATRTLEEAQIAKYDRLCRLLKLQPTDHVLEIGSGWGGFSLYAAKNYGCKITTVTISQEQFNFAHALFKKENVADRVTTQ